MKRDGGKKSESLLVGFIIFLFFCVYLLLVLANNRGIQGTLLLKKKITKKE
jgi:hypothetical protein